MEHSVILHSLLSFFLLSLLKTPIAAVQKHYIVYLGSFDGGRPLEGNPEDVTRSHHDMISSVSKRNNGSDPSEKLIYSYTKIFNGFAAILHEEEVEELAKHPDVISIFENRCVKQHTTQSWDFLGSFPHQNVPNDKGSIWEKAKFGEDIIIAGVDSGIWPESKSFSDEGFSSTIPSKFKGTCSNENDPTFKCNKKVIGARYFNKGLIEILKQNKARLLPKSLMSKSSTPRDMGGHGTHTLSTAGGNVVSKPESLAMTILGLKNYTVKGGAPKARLVTYKVLWPESISQGNDMGEGSSLDCLAGTEAAIHDGVDIINLSVGFMKNDLDHTKDYYLNDAFSIATFHAMANNILVVGSAGNDGPTPSTVNHVAPWILTVGAGTIDREFSCHLFLGNNQTLKAARYMDAESNLSDRSYYPLITGADARNINANLKNASYCEPGSLDAVKVTGKILVCLLDGPSNMAEKSAVAVDKGALGLILANDRVFGSRMLPDVMHSVPTAHVNYKDSHAVFSYINSSRTPVAKISNTTTELGIKPAPVIPDFTSRGPNDITPEILKPDIMAPGVSIVAAYVETQTVETPDKFLPLSGTSMSAPHISGIAALLRKLHPTWSISAIKSAIMTTASSVDNNGKPMIEDDLVHQSTPLAYGSGLVQPNLAMDPGLVYDLNLFDYLDFLCAQNYNATTLKIFAKQHNHTCTKSFSILDFNYPSISIPQFSGAATATRKLKNVGEPGTYTARVEAPTGVSIIVEPKTLMFSRKDQELKFKLVFSGDVNRLPNGYAFGSIVWSDGKHIVRSPIAVKRK